MVHEVILHFFRIEMLTLLQSIANKSISQINQIVHLLKLDASLHVRYCILFVCVCVCASWSLRCVVFPFVLLSHIYRIRHKNRLTTAIILQNHFENSFQTCIQLIHKQFQFWFEFSFSLSLSPAMCTRCKLKIARICARVCVWQLANQAHWLMDIYSISRHLIFILFCIYFLIDIDDFFSLLSIEE